ncbi:MAG: YdeI/OmpD-associated family protein [Myxococcales bacterium]
MPKRAEKSGARIVTFRTTIRAAGKNAAGIVVPPELVTVLDHGKRPPVRVTIGDHTYPSTVAVMGGKFMVGVSVENRKLAGVEAGDAVDVTLELDAAPRETALPIDFAKALAAVPEAKKFFERLSPSMKKFHVTNINDAKTDETRSRRIAKSVDTLKAGRPR